MLSQKLKKMGFSFFFPLNCPIKEYNEIKLIFIETHLWILGDTYSTNQALGYMQMKIFRVAINQLEFLKQI